MNQKEFLYSYDQISLYANGTFSCVYKAFCKKENKYVAIKKIIIDKNLQQRELEIIRSLNHANCIKLLDYRTYQDLNQQILELVTEFISFNLYQFQENFNKIKNDQRNFLNSKVRIFSHQILVALNYLHSNNICHRDIKPKNILVDHEENKIIICDFGSAKKLETNDQNIDYIQSRCYRAPEILFGNLLYNQQIDMWSAGCVLAEMALENQPLFQGENSAEIMFQIIQLLGTPDEKYIQKMGSVFNQDFEFPKIPKTDFNQIFEKQDILFIDLLQKLLVYDPEIRLNSQNALRHQYFENIDKIDISLKKSDNINQLEIEQSNQIHNPLKMT